MACHLELRNVGWSASGSPNISQPDKALIAALAHAHQWQNMLAKDEMPSIEALASKFGKDRGHVGKTLKLAFLSPAIVKGILDGEHGSQLLFATNSLCWPRQSPFQHSPRPPWP